MDIINTIFGTFFGFILQTCYLLVEDFGIALILFTLLTKVILFPLSLASQKNSIILVKIQPMLEDLQSRYSGELETLIKEQKTLYKKENYSTIKALLPLLIQIPLIIGVISVVNHPEQYLGEISKHIFLGIDMFALPVGWLVPALAIISTALLCILQNSYNVISREQGFFAKWGVMIFLVAFTGWFSIICPAGLGLYWTYSNSFSIVTLFICNLIYNPKKYIDYENRTVKVKLTKAEKIEIKERKKQEKAREKEDMKRFFSREKELVFYSDSSGFYKYFQHFIEYILDNSDITIHYLTADINDQVFAIERPNFECYFCTSNGLISTFMKMDSDIVVMTMPDLETYHYKRSIVKKDIEYIYVNHGIGSFHMVLRKGAIDHYDTIFCYSKNHNEEILATEKVYNLPAKKLVNVGFGLLDMLIEDYNRTEHPKHDKPWILIAPSWQKDNILESCIDALLVGLFALDVKIIIRPHPEFVKRFAGKMKIIFEKYADKLGPDFEIQTDFASNSTVYNSDLVITDWSSIASEFSFTTKKPVLFINTTMKVMNLEWKKIEIEPMDIWIREKIGVSLNIEDLRKVSETVKEILANNDKYKTSITKLVEDLMYNIGSTAEVGGNYIIEQIIRKREENEKSNNEFKD